MEPQNFIQTPNLTPTTIQTPKPNYNTLFTVFLLGLIFGSTSLYLTEKYILKLNLSMRTEDSILAETGNPENIIPSTTPSPTGLITANPTPTSLVATPAIPTITTKATPSPKQQPKTGWTSYTNDKYKFSFDYPYQYVLQDTSGGDFGYAPGDITLAYFVNSDKQQLMINLDNNPFDLSYLKKYSPTGQEGASPTKVTSSSFYYYGPGGGGVCYPDQYFTKLGNKTLIFTFDGCTNDKTPPAATKEIAAQLISTFKAF